MSEWKCARCFAAHLDDTFRWLTVGPPGQDDVSIVLMAVPGEPVMDEATRKQVRDLTAKGFAGTVFLATENFDILQGNERARSRIHRGAARDALRHRLGFRDPSGNSVRLTQLTGS